MVRAGFSGDHGSLPAASFPLGFRFALVLCGETHTIDRVGGTTRKEKPGHQGRKEVSLSVPGEKPKPKPKPKPSQSRFRNHRPATDWMDVKRHTR